MQNRPVWFARGSARVSRANASPARTFGVAPKQSFPNAEISGGRIAEEKSAIARRARQHPSRARSPIRLAALLALRASRLLWTGTLADSFADRSGGGVSRRLRNAFRYSTRSIARHCERNFLGRYRAKTNPACEQCASRSAWAFRGADGNSRPVDLRFHARVAQ